MRVFGVDKKPRFSIKCPDGSIIRFGTCDPRDQDRASIVEIEGDYYLSRSLMDGKYEKLELLTNEHFVTNGYYDHEHTGWVTPKELLEQWKQ